MDSNLSNVPAADALFLEFINELGQRMHYWTHTRELAEVICANDSHTF
jgi:hypothetical protein